MLEVNEIVKDLRDLVTRAATYAPKNRYFLQEQCQDNPKNLTLLMSGLGISQTGLDGLLASLASDKLGANEKTRLEKCLFYHKWQPKNRSQYATGLFGQSHDAQKAYGLANLMLRSNKDLPLTASMFPTLFFLTECGLDNFLMLQGASLHVLRTLTRSSLSGKVAVKRGYSRERVYQAIFDALNIKYRKNCKLYPEGKTWDLVFKDKIALEISDHSSTGSGISLKKKAMFDDIHFLRSKKWSGRFIMAAGGAGWLQRPSDLEPLKKELDEFYDLSEAGTVNLVCSISQKLGAKHTKKKIEKVVSDKWN